VWQLELLLRSATAAGVTSRVIEGARLLVAQLRAMGDRDRIQVPPIEPYLGLYLSSSSHYLSTAGTCIQVL
jgi:hypothetical protein